MSAEEPLVFHLRVTGSRVMGTLRGNVRDGVTGQAIQGVTVFVPRASLKVAVQADGSFEATLNAGRFQLLGTAPGYETQKKEVYTQGDQVLILHVDLQPKQGRDVRKAMPAKSQH